MSYFFHFNQKRTREIERESPCCEVKVLICGSWANFGVYFRNQEVSAILSSSDIVVAFTKQQLFVLVK